MIKALLFSAVAATAVAHKGGHKDRKGPEVPEPVINMCNNTCRLHHLHPCLRHQLTNILLKFNSQL